jgi:dTDP-4-dehydrorhamnose 3,5-epimerase-like enzyme
MGDWDLGIEGLCWEARHVIENGADSVVVPFPTTDLVHLVYHGDGPFAHGRYGLHRGLEDRLTFFGPPNKPAVGYFVDCRRGSPTLHCRIRVEFSPSSQQTLAIPPGVGHGFSGLEGVYTLNSFRAYLPPPEHLLTAQNPWATGSDIYNFPYDTDDASLPVIDTNPYPASPVFYEVLSKLQKATLGSLEYDFPHTEDFTNAQGEVMTLEIRKRLSVQQQLPDWVPVEGIEGVGWRKHLLVWAGESAGYAALTDPSPFQVIDHGNQPYSTDAYGIHLEWEDRLTFVGQTERPVRVKLLDCRSASPTIGREVVHEFKSSPLRYLVLPPGVAHGFEGLESIFTINRPIRRAGDPSEFEPGNDVIDWPLSKRPGPSFEIVPRDFPFAYYRDLAARQREYLGQRDMNLSTPAVLLVDGGDGTQVRVAIRRTVSNSLSPQPLQVSPVTSGN